MIKERFIKGDDFIISARYPVSFEYGESYTDLKFCISAEGREFRQSLNFPANFMPYVGEPDRIEAFNDFQGKFLGWIMEYSDDDDSFDVGCAWREVTSSIIKAMEKDIKKQKKTKGSEGFVSV